MVNVQSKQNMIHRLRAFRFVSPAFPQFEQRPKNLAGYFNWIKFEIYHSFDDFPKYYMLPIKPLGFHGGHKELWAYKTQLLFKPSAL